MFKVKYVDSIMMLVRLDLNLIVSLFQHKCEVSETVSTTTLYYYFWECNQLIRPPKKSLVSGHRSASKSVR